MIHSILHQIWNQRRSNGWLFAELLIVFTLMWYCVDVLYGFAHAERQPKGYDLEHVYKIRISCNPTQIVPCKSEDSLQTFWFKPMEEVLRRIRQYPAVESAATWLGTDTYTRGRVYQGYTTDSVHVVETTVRYVSPEYFDVMRIPLLQGNVSDWNSTASPLPAVVTRDLADTTIRQNERSNPFFQFQYMGSDGRILQYRYDISCFYGFTVFSIYLLNFSTSSCHDPYGRMLCGDGDSGTYYIRVFEERAADEKQCQYPEEYGYSPPDQCVWRSRQYLLHLLTPQFYVLFFLFLHNSQLSIFNSPLIKVPIGSSPACNIFLPEQSALHAFRSLLSCPVL